MSVENFLNLMRLQASMVNNGRSSTALGTVIGYDQTNYYVNVQLSPANPIDPSSQALSTGWIPLFSPWVGNGWGFFAAPNIGDIVEIHFQEGSQQASYAGMRCFQMGQNLEVPPSECWLVHETGAYIKMLTSGEIDIVSGVTGSPPINITSTGLVNITGANVNVSGTVKLGNLSGTLTSLLTGAAMSIYNTHTHPQQGGGNTSIPTQQMTSSDVTSNVSAN